MECGKLTAKLRDAVPVYLIEEGRSPMRYKNIQIPNEIKALEYKDFKFDVQEYGKISFKIYFEPGTLPATQPEAREQNHREAKSEAETDPVPEADAETEPARIEINYNVVGEVRKALVTAIGEHLGIKPRYLGISSQAFQIGDYIVSKDGLMIGPNNPSLRQALIERGFTE